VVLLLREGRRGIPARGEAFFLFFSFLFFSFLSCLSFFFLLLLVLGAASSLYFSLLYSALLPFPSLSFPSLSLSFSLQRLQPFFFFLFSFFFLFFLFIPLAPQNPFFLKKEKGLNGTGLKYCSFLKEKKKNSSSSSSSSSFEPVAEPWGFLCSLSPSPFLLQASFPCCIRFMNNEP